MAYERLMISLRSSEGISLDEMYNDMIRKARSSKLRSRHSVSHPSGRDGISSGMNKPPSEASPLRTTSSKDSWKFIQLAKAQGESETEHGTYPIRGTPRAKILLRKSVRHGRLEGNEGDRRKSDTITVTSPYTTSEQVRYSMDAKTQRRGPTVAMIHPTSNLSFGPSQRRGEDLSHSGTSAADNGSRKSRA